MKRIVGESDEEDCGRVGRRGLWESRMKRIVG